MDFKTKSVERSLDLQRLFLYNMKTMLISTNPIPYILQGSLNASSMQQMMCKDLIALLINLD